MTVFRRGAIYHYDFILHGIRHAGTTRTRNRRAAERYEADIRGKEEARYQASREPGSVSLEEGMKRLYTERWSRTRDHARTQARAKRIISILGADTPLAAIDAPKVSAMAAALRKDGLKDSSVNRYLAALKTLLLTASREWGAISSVPYIKLARETQGRLRTFTVEEEEEIQGLLRHGEAATPLSIETADLFLLLADTGMRLSEGLRLESRDVNPETGLIHVWESKGDRPRSIPMTERVRAMLQPRLNGGGTSRVFSGFKEGKLGAHQVKGLWKRRVKKIEGGNFADARIHDYRHTYASRLVQMGCPLYSVQRLLGHSTPLMTQRYAHLAPESFQESAKLLDSLVKTKEVAIM